MVSINFACWLVPCVSPFVLIKLFTSVEIIQQIAKATILQNLKKIFYKRTLKRSPTEYVRQLLSDKNPETAMDIHSMLTLKSSIKVIELILLSFCSLIRA
jgi:uncharacterized membrane-anchored protein